MTELSYRRVFVALLVMVTATGVAFGGQRPAGDEVRRTSADVARDRGSKPLEVYEFLGIQPGMRVVDAMPGGGYNTYVLTSVVGDDGTVYSGPDRRGALGERLGETPLDNVEVIGGFDELPAGGIDVILTVRNFHDLVNGGREAGALAQWMTALKPGGALGIVDARTTMDGFDGNTHRINQQTVIDAVTAAGFELVEASELLGNPDDDVSVSAETGNRYDTDRMLLKFRKPGN